MIFDSDAIFEDIPGDPDNVIMKIPPEVLETMGWVVDDALTISALGGTIIISKNS